MNTNSLQQHVNEPTRRNNILYLVIKILDLNINRLENTEKIGDHQMINLTLEPIACLDHTRLPDSLLPELPDGAPCPLGFLERNNFLHSGSLGIADRQKRELFAAAHVCPEQRSDPLLAFLSSSAPLSPESYGLVRKQLPEESSLVQVEDVVCGELPEQGPENLLLPLKKGLQIHRSSFALYCLERDVVALLEIVQPTVARHEVWDVHQLGQFHHFLLDQIAADRQILSSGLLQPHEHPRIELQVVSLCHLHALRWNSSFDSRLDCILLAEDALHCGALNFDAIFLAHLPGQLRLIRFLLHGGIPPTPPHSPHSPHSPSLPLTPLTPLTP
ncbi:hypothetical protein FHG87_024304, partial [Trinorchestia longiramus]